MFSLVVFAFARGNHRHVFEFDEHPDTGRLLAATILPDLGLGAGQPQRIRFGYDAQGRLSSVIDREGQMTHYAYEAPDVWLRGDPGADWLRNLEGHHSCLFIVGAHAIAATREQVADEGAALRHVVELWRSKYGAEWVADWYVERGRVPVRLRLVTR